MGTRHNVSMAADAAAPTADRPDVAVMRTARTLTKAHPQTYLSLPETLEAIRKALPGQPGRNTWLAYVNWLATGGAPDDAVAAVFKTIDADKQIASAIGKAAKEERLGRKIAAHQANLNERHTMTPLDPAQKLAEARRLFMSEHGLKGLEGIKAADAALRATKPELLTEYAGFVVSGGTLNESPRGS